MAVRPCSSSIPLTCDSAGGGLSLALLQLILEFQRQGTSITWHGSPRTVPLPASVACNSPWLDITQSSPTWQGNTPAPFDYLPKPAMIHRDRVPNCAAWPSTPPRHHIYVADDLATHPLASPLMSRSWAGSPPIFICTGWEILAHEDKFFARHLTGSEGVRVVFEEFEGMPHVFAIIIPGAGPARRSLDGSAGFIRRSVDDPAGIESSAVAVRARTLEEVPLKFEELSEVTDEEMREQVTAHARRAPASQAKL